MSTNYSLKPCLRNTPKTFEILESNRQLDRRFFEKFFIFIIFILQKYYLYNLKMGKVHGSLTRAGKVRNQTPKVEKLPKKKKLTGRAKMRFLYNKRFVHVVEEQGRRRAGPNSNKNK
ncbi:40S ribosomal protein S30/UBIQUITIN-LIKE PROTEIN FUBI [Anaeramoeba flamelloides]|uniref:40S ribosomal protein S30/UBIQUITIN-LIKE PROTEIN FUBI n=1 Tax=Anaeramoeba flamelloides TaxID=1746091 RepID=A0ABQ8X9J1_9EUKA|nr:40S ribosomal protein S30/UBIQUITIN-LIKE PROTEIN FUBI [Anaeramoeba flamelloides]